MTSHYQKLESFFLKSPINKKLEGNIKITQGYSEIKFSKKKFMHNEIDNIHSAYIFMALNESAFFAANSLIEDVFVSNKSFEIIFLKSSESDNFIVKSNFLEKSMGNYVILAELYDSDNILISKAKAIFRRSKNPLTI